MERYEIIKNRDNFLNRLTELNNALNITKVKQELEANNLLMANPSFWNDPNNSSIVLKNVKKEKDIIDKSSDLQEKLDDLDLYISMYDEESDTVKENATKEIDKLIDAISTELSEFEISMLLNGEYDQNDAIMEMHPGAGGTESQDWCEMLYRMYTRYAENNGFQVEVLDYQAGDEAGIKSVTFMIKGENAYGYLQSEQGVHRLVRISPFDSNARRHTSFCGVTVIPSIDKNINIEINPGDIRVDTYRASGAGGQYINKTDSAIRITHLATNIVVTCQTQRSQFQNKDAAMNVLKAKLYQKELAEKNKKIKEISGDTELNGFGSQIRSYVFQPYTLIKDHRTNFEDGNITAVMDGRIDGFINAYLKYKYTK
ncbi:MAG: peptide chain release factor 2 [Bacilli bacterium]